MTEQELYEQDRDNRVNADMPDISFSEWQLREAIFVEWELQGETNAS